MKLFLETIHAGDVQELSQFAPLDGVICHPNLFSAQSVDVRKSIDEILEVLPESSALFVPVIQSGFRNILAEARQLTAISKQIVPVIPYSPEGLMALKACSTLKIKAACSKISRPAQAAMAIGNNASVLLVSQRLAKKAGAACEMEKMLDTLSLKNGEEGNCPETIVCDFPDLSEASGYFCMESAGLALKPEQIREILDDQTIKNEIQEEKDNWVFAYTRMELFE